MASRQRGERASRNPNPVPLPPQPLPSSPPPKWQWTSSCAEHELPATTRLLRIDVEVIEEKGDAIMWFRPLMDALDAKQWGGDEDGFLHDISASGPTIGHTWGLDRAPVADILARLRTLLPRYGRIAMLIMDASEEPEHEERVYDFVLLLS